MKAFYVIPALVIVAATALSSVFTVDEREKVLVLQFGEIKQVIDKPGLYLKVPFIQDILKYDDRILGLTTAPQEFPLADNRRLVVDAFARWRIVDLEKFRRAVGSGGVDAASANLAAIVAPEVRDVLGEVTVEAVLSSSRVGLMNKIRDNAREKAASLGGGHHRRAPDADRSATAEPAGNLCPDAGRTPARGDRRDCAR